MRAEWSTEDARWTVEAERTDTGETVQLTCGFLFVVHRLLPLRRGLHARLRGHRALRRPDRPPAALARGPRLRGQAGRRDRQRRDRRHARPGAGRDGRARHDAAALAELHRLAARRGPDRRRAAPRAARQGSPTPLVRWKNVAARRRWSSSSAGAGPSFVKRADPQAASSASCRRATTSTPTSRPRYNPWDQRLCLVPDGDLFTGDPRRAARRSSPTRSRPSPRTGSRLESGARARGRHHRHRHGPEPARARRHRSSSSTASEVELPEHARLQGHDAQRRARTWRSRSATRTRRGRSSATSPATTSAGCSTTWTRTATASARPRNHDPSLADASRFIDLTSGYVLRSIDRFPKQGSQGPVAPAPELPARHHAAAVTARWRTGRWSSPRGLPRASGRRSRSRPEGFRAGP